MNCKIIGFENGPLEVDCADAVWMKDGKKLEVENPSHPCRCGKSKNKPFCDGSHVKAGFESKREISEEVLQTYKGKEITVNFNRSICAGAGECVEVEHTAALGQGADDLVFDEQEQVGRQVGQQQWGWRVGRERRVVEAIDAAVARRLEPKLAKLPGALGELPRSQQHEMARAGEGAADVLRAQLETFRKH